MTNDTSRDPLARLSAEGVAVWLDDLSRELLAGGSLQSLITGRRRASGSGQRSLASSSAGSSAARAGSPGTASPMPPPLSPYSLLCVSGSGIPRSLVANRNSGQVGALLDIECQSFRSLRLARWRDRYSLHRPVLSRFGACRVLIGHGFQPFR